MYVGEGKVTDIIEWFRNNSSARLLGVFVGGSPKYDKFINDVLRKSLAIDVISGSKIDLSFCLAQAGELIFFERSLETRLFRPFHLQNSTKIQRTIMDICHQAHFGG
jgi:hypothetical protein